MSNETNADAPVGVSSGGVTVTKEFEGEEFAVPAIKFEIRSEADEPVQFRLTDYIPTDFPMDSVGFHPDFENENWTAYKDHRVRFERTIDPDEVVTTVYGIRLSDPEEAPEFLGKPELAEVTSDDGESDDPLAEPDAGATGEVEEGTLIDIVSEDSSQVVRDVISGESDTVPGLEDDGETPDDPLADTLAADGPDDSPLIDDQPDDSPILDDERDDAPGLDDEPDDPPFLGEPPTDESDGSTADEPNDPLSDELQLDDPLDENTTADAPEPADADDAPELDDADDSAGAPELDDAADSDDVTDAPAAAVPAEGIGAALAAEIREGNVSDADLRILRRELDFEQPESTNVRIRHLQSRVEDLAAYTQALEEFLDENGTAEQLLSEFEEEVAGLTEDVADMESRLGTDEETLARIEDLEAELESVDVGEEFESVHERFEELEELVGANTSDTTALTGEVESIKDDLETELSDVAAEVDSVSDQLDSVEGDLDGRLDTIESDVRDVKDELAEIQEWRSQLSTVFSPGEE